MGCGGSLLISPTSRIGSLDAFGRFRVSDVGTIFDSKQVYSSGQDQLLFDSLTSSGGTVTYQQLTASSELATTSTLGSRAVRSTRRYFNYQPGKSFLVLATFNLRSTDPGARKRVGYFDDDNGLFLQCNSGIISFVRRSSTSGSPVDEEVTQENWSIDRFDGTGPSGITLDLTKVQILFVDFEWLGVGTARLGFVENGQVFYAHAFDNANIGEVVYMQTPNLPVRWEVETVGAGSGGALDSICCSVAAEGSREPLGVVRSANRGSSPLGISTNNPRSLITIRLSPTHLRASVRLLRFTTLLTTNNNYAWELILNPTFAGGSPVWQAASDAVEFDVDRTDFITGGTMIDSGYISNNVEGFQGTFSDDIFLASSIDGTPDEVALVIDSIGTGFYLGSLTWLEFS